MAEITHDVERAFAILKAGKLIGMPTETVYGLAARADQADAVAQVYEVKQRPAFDPLICHFHNTKALTPYVKELPEQFWALYERFSPGPLTYILAKSERVSDLITAGHPTVAVRFPRHPLTRQLLQQCDFPVVAPSANLFGKVSPTQAQHVKDQLGDHIDLILDGGAAEIGLESTIIDLSGPQVKVLRLGGLALEELSEALGKTPEIAAHSSSNPKAPGMLSAHYSPGIKILFGKIMDNLKLIDPERTGSISFCQKIQGIPARNQRVLSPRCDLKEAAAQLFTALRSFDPAQIDVILCEEFPQEGLGRAINDRLKRASVA